MFDLGGTIGGLLFIRLVAPQGLKLMGAREAHAVEGRCFRLVRVSLATALFGLLGWLALEASDMSGAANAADVLAAIPTVLLGTSFGHDLFVQALSVFAALALVTARPQRWRCVAVGLAGLALALQARTATPSPWSIAPACCSMPKDCTSLPRCLARKSAAAAYPGTPRPAEARSRDAGALLKARHVLRRRHRGNRLLPGVGARRRRGRVDRNRLWLSASPQGGALCRSARDCRHQPLSPYPGDGTPRRTAGKTGVHAHHRGGNRDWAHGCACGGAAERP